MERYRTTIILLVLLVALGGLAIALGGNRGATTTGEPTPVPPAYVWQEQNPVSGLDAVSATQRLVLVKDVTTTIWSIREPISDTADPFAVGNLADQLQSLQATSTITDAANLADFGLASPAVTITVAFSDTAGTRRSLLIGNQTIDGSAYYAKTPEGAEVYLVSNSVIEPVRSWFASPPKVVPTPTPLLPTLGPTQEVTATGTITGAVLPGVSPGATGTTTPQAQATGEISGTETITARPPAGANATTPETSPLVPTATQPGAVASPTP
ncbi:MAG: DUF4340 domain-containing protein [Chloroflexota bacterium]|nr:DUF4340 domain-containing protein [Chloroflexota bacterium]